MQTLLAMVEAGLGIGIVPSCVMNLSHKDLSFLPISPKNTSLDLYMHWRNDREDLVSEAFIDLVKSKKFKSLCQ